MKNNLIRILRYTGFILLMGLIISVAISDDISAQKKSKKKKKKKSSVGRWELNVGFRTIYDDNILKNSDKYLERFHNREDEGRFHIETEDDIIIQQSVGISYSNRFFGRLKTEFSTDADFKLYAHNPVKNFYIYSFGLRQYVSKKIHLKFAYTHIPEFYVRHFRDEEWVNLVGYTEEAFQPYEFAKDDYSFYLHHSLLSKTSYRLYLSFMKYFHNKHFTEYDCDNYHIGAKIYQKITNKIKIDLAYDFIYSEATRVSKDPRVLGNTIVDPTNDEHILSLGVGYTLPKILGKKNSLSVSAKYYRRFYTTDIYHELDPLHAGRYDYNYRVFLNYDIDLIKGVSTSFFYNWLLRESSTSVEENKEAIAEEKDYRQNIFGIKLGYKFKL